MKLALVLLSLCAVSAFAQYDPNLAMTSLWYSKTAYCDASDISSWSCPTCSHFPGFQLQGVYKNGTFDAQGYTGVAADGTIVVAFRGSSNIPNWIADLSFKLVPYSACTGCKVHWGFYQVYLELANSILSDVRQLVAANPSATVLVTGHSLGAAVSMHAAVDIMNKIAPSSLTLYNFGEPRVGNPAFAAWAASVLPQGKQFRVTHEADPVPHLPPMSWGFLHCPHELWYNNDGDSSYSDCNDSPSAEDPNCSDSTIPINIADHLLYLGVCTGCGCSGKPATHYKVQMPSDNEGRVIVTKKE